MHAGCHMFHKFNDGLDTNFVEMCFFFSSETTVTQETMNI